MMTDMPMFGICMKPLPVVFSDHSVEYDEALESLAVMTAQDSAYKCSDYFTVLREMCPQLKTLHRGNSCPMPGLAVDEICREKMCEWSYRVCDHFRTSREVVAVAFSFLDRFLDKYDCDRNTFKLASMTSFFIATKLLNVKQISITSLAELSRGEFETEHIAEMERLILDKLQWRMNPPTVQSFILYLRTILPRTEYYLHEEIYQRAIFFAEISVYDYSFATEERYLLGVACILNAIEGVDDVNHAKELRHEYLGVLNASLCVDVDPASLDRAQKKLWYLYSCSAQIQYEDILPRSYSKERINLVDTKYGNASYSHSPVGVGHLT